MCNLSWQVRGGLSEEVTFEQRLREMKSRLFGCLGIHGPAEEHGAKADVEAGLCLVF